MGKQSASTRPLRRSRRCARCSRSRASSAPRSTCTRSSTRSRRRSAETLGFRTVAINLYRPAWDDFQIAIVHGNEDARAALLVGHATRSSAGRPSWTSATSAAARTGSRRRTPGASRHGPRSYTPAARRVAVSDVDAWHPEDSLIVPLQGIRRRAPRDGLRRRAADGPPADRRRDRDPRRASSAHAALRPAGGAGPGRGRRHRPRSSTCSRSRRS